MSNLWNVQGVCGRIYLMVKMCEGLNIKRKELFLIPVPLSSSTLPQEVLPSSVLETVKSLRCFFVEELRSARRFLKSVDRNFDIDGSDFFVVNEHTRDIDSREITDILIHRERVGVISEAGCPGVADPGAMVVGLARQNGYKIIPMVGPSSILLGLMASGFNGQNFAFNGYLPHDPEQRRKKLSQLVKKVTTEDQTQIFIETPYRNNKLIEEIVAFLPSDLKFCVACDLTSQDEVVIVESISVWKKLNYDFSRRPAIFLIGK